MPAVVIAIAAAAMCAAWYYRGTVPEIFGWKRHAMTAVRFTALALLIAALAEPVIRLAVQVDIPEKTVVLTDVSSSIDSPLDPDRKAAVMNTSRTLASSLGDRGRFLTFSGDLREDAGGSGDDAFDGAATDISRALTGALAADDVASVILISDGRWNLGENPADTAARAGVPVHAVLVGSAEESPEVILRSYSSDPVVQEGDTLSVRLTIAARGAVEGPVPVTVSAAGRVLGSTTVSVTPGGAVTVAVDVPLSGTGRRVLTAAIDPPNDTITGNNSRSFAVQVMKSRFAVAIVAAKPSPDLAFIRRALESDPSLEVTTVVSEGESADPARDVTEKTFDVDAIVCVDGGGDVIARYADTITTMVADGAGLWMLGTESPPRSLDPVLPARLNREAGQVSEEFSVRLTTEGGRHFLTSGTAAAGVSFEWELLPPLTSVAPSEPDSTRGNILVRAVSGNPTVDSVPVLVSGRHGKGKVLFMPVDGIWRWQLMLAGAQGDGSFYSSFVTGAVHWLAAEADTSPLAIETDRPTYMSGEEIGLTGRLYDSVFSPVSGADVSVTIDDSPELKVFLEEREPARYAGSLSGLSPGTHMFVATAFVGNARFAETEGTFTVEPFSLEMLDTSPDPALMGSIALKSGGLSVTAAGVDSVTAVLTYTDRTERREHEKRLAFSPILPVAAIVLLLLEWAVRKARGML